jgi:hypothetical protein
MRNTTVVVVFGLTLAAAAPAHANRLTEAARVLFSRKAKPARPVVVSSSLVKQEVVQPVQAPHPVVHYEAAQQVETIKPVVVTSSSVQLAVLGARSARFTPGFDEVFKDAVKQIKELHAAGHIEEAQERALEAVRAYMDHHQLTLGGSESAARYFGKVYTAQAGLSDVLKW